MHREPIETVRKLTDAWIRKDKKGMSDCMTEDIVEIGPVFPQPLEGKNRFFATYDAYFAGPLEIVSYRILRPNTLRISPRFALVHFRYRMRTRLHGSAENSGGKESMLLEKKRGRWLVKFIHWHRDP